VRPELTVLGIAQLSIVATVVERVRNLGRSVKRSANDEMTKSVIARRGTPVAACMIENDEGVDLLHTGVMMCS
jgi:hypothetical protein